MSKYLCTFSGKFGDILWSLPTARFISERVVNAPVDFACMPYYKSLLPLLASQPYIDRAFVIEDWLRQHSNHGDQPWLPPEKRTAPAESAAVQITTASEVFEYDRAWHLGYKGHPGISAPSMPLIDFVAYQQGINFNGWNPIPFITPDENVEALATPVHFSTGQLPKVIEERRLIAYAFNEQYDEAKKIFFETLWKETRQDELEFFNVAEVGWKEAAWIISKALLYVGDRSACWVLANGVGAEIITFEPHPSRHKDCHLGTVFGCPYGKEVALPFGLPPLVAGQSAAAMIRKRATDVKYASVT